MSTRRPATASRIPPSGPPASRTTPSRTALSEFALASTGPVPTMAGVAARIAGPNAAAPALSAATAA
jgi:hypothetical protein